MLPLGLQCVLLYWCLLMYVYGYSINALDVKKTVLYKIFLGACQRIRVCAFAGVG